MRIVVWNVNKAFDRKIDALLGLEPDVAILPESSKTPYWENQGSIGSWHWIGREPKSGLGVLIGEDLKCDLPLTRLASPIEWFGGLRIGRQQQPVVTVIAAWSCYTGTPKKEEPGPTLKALPDLVSSLEGQQAIFAGDFNNSALWDKPGRADNFGNLVEQLESDSLKSAYHHFFSEHFGSENRPTFFSQRNRKKSYHLDYCFLSRSLIDRVEKVEVGAYEDWISLSDHMPLIVDLK